MDDGRNYIPMDPADPSSFLSAADDGDRRDPFLKPRPSRVFAIVLGVVQVVLLIGFAVLTTSAEYKAENATQNVQLYNYLSGVMLMMLVGFGYLMTFLRWYGLGAVGYTLLITCLGAQVALLAESLFKSKSWDNKHNSTYETEHFWQKDGQNGVDIGLPELLDAMFAVAAMLISFGGLIGKINPKQLLLLVCAESVFYSANKQLILTRWLDIKDCGGTIIIHMFGAYFGLAIAYVLGEPDKGQAKTFEKSSTMSDVTSLIGTTVLWVYWPSFVAGTLVAGSHQAELALVNTVLALVGSTVATFIATSLFLNADEEDGKVTHKLFSPVDVQNAALAGGVSIGAVANLGINPFGAILIGCLAGTLSTVGYHFIQPFLLEKLGLHDTCGIHNLHGMPSLLGGLASAIVPHVINSAAGTGSSGHQLAGIGLTLVVAISSGGFTGFLMKYLGNKGKEFEDRESWIVADDFGKEI